MPWDFGRLTLRQLYMILDPSILKTQKTFAALSRLKPASDAREALAVSHDAYRQTLDLRYRMFDKLCEERKLTKPQLAALDDDTLVNYLMISTGLGRDKFPPAKVRMRIAEYVTARGGKA